MSDLSDEKLRGLRPGNNIDRVSVVIMKRDLGLILDELERHRATMKRLLEWQAELETAVIPLTGPMVAG